jgi:hypothetical protein
MFSTVGITVQVRILFPSGSFTRALIDNGAHLVLIRPELVAKLGLKVYHQNHRCRIQKAAAKEN